MVKLFYLLLTCSLFPLALFANDRVKCANDLVSAGHSYSGARYFCKKVNDPIAIKCAVDLVAAGHSYSSSRSYCLQSRTD